jgi:hypothetical protein
MSEDTAGSQARLLDMRRTSASGQFHGRVPAETRMPANIKPDGSGQKAR